MKKLLITSLLLSMPLMAQDATATQDGGQRGPRNAQAQQGQRGQNLDAAMEKFDKDNDGKLDAKEFAAFRHAMSKHGGPSPKMLEKYDTDKDGKLSKEERQAMKEDRKANKPDREPLTDEQKEARRAKRAERNAKILAKFDQNNDGYLDKQELAKMRKAKGDKKGPKAHGDKKGKGGQKGKRQKD